MYILSYFFFILSLHSSYFHNVPSEGGVEDAEEKMQEGEERERTKEMTKRSHRKE